MGFTRRDTEFKGGCDRCGATTFEGAKLCLKCKKQALEEERKKRLVGKIPERWRTQGSEGINIGDSWVTANGPLDRVICPICDSYMVSYESNYEVKNFVIVHILTCGGCRSTFFAKPSLKSEELVLKLKSIDPLPDPWRHM